MSFSTAEAVRDAVSVVKLTLIVLASTALLMMPQLKLLALHQSFFDLGQYATSLFALAFSDEGGQLLQGHAHLVAPFYAAIYRLYPSPTTLLVLQSLFLVGSTVLAGVLFRRIGAGSRIDGALIFACAFPVWFSALFEFHFEHLVFPLIFGATLGLLRGKASGRIAFAVCVVLLCFTKETYALTAAMLGVWAALFRRERILGIATIMASLAYFAFVTGTIIPFFSRGLQSGDIWASAFGGLGRSVSEMIWTLLSNPLATARLVLSTRKVLYVTVLAGIFAFVWCWRPQAAIVSLPALGMSLVSDNPNHFYLGNQYTAAVTAPLFVATAFSLAAIQPDHRVWAKRAILACVGVTLVIFGPSPLSRLFLQDATFSYGASAFLPTERDNRITAAIDRFVPSDPSVPVAVQNGLVTQHLTARRALMPFPAGTDRPFRLLMPVQEGIALSILRALREKGPATSEDIFAEYVVLDRKRPLDLFDRGCDFLHDACQDAEAIASFNAISARLTSNFEPIYENDGLSILRRRSPAINAKHSELQPTYGSLTKTSTIR